MQINSNEWGHHGALLANIWFPWLTRGLFIGQRRYLLSAQVCPAMIPASSQQ